MQELRGRVAELDGLRGLAVVMVLCWHYMGAMIDTKLGFWAQLLFDLTRPGRVGVDLFFVLSGFLITGIILERKQSVGGFLASFYVRRALRIAPPYFLLVSVFWCNVYVRGNDQIFNASTHFLYHLSFTQNIWMAINGLWGASGISVTWSVAIEEQFYLLFPLLLLTLPSRLIPVTLVLIACASAVFRIIVFLYFSHESAAKAAFFGYVFTLSRLDGLSLGALVAWAIRDHRAIEFLRGRSSALVKYLSRACIVGLLLVIAIKFSLVKNMMYWGHTFLAIFFALLILVVVLQQGSPRWAWLRNPILRRVGGLSYFIYLFHPLALSVVFRLAGLPEQVRSPSHALLAASALVIVMITAEISRRFIETPAISIGKRYSY